MPEATPHDQPPPKQTDKFATQPLRPLITEAQKKQLDSMLVEFNETGKKLAQQAREALEMRARIKAEQTAATATGLPDYTTPDAEFLESLKDKIQASRERDRISVPDDLLNSFEAAFSETSILPEESTPAVQKKPVETVSPQQQEAARVEAQVAEAIWTQYTDNVSVLLTAGTERLIFRVQQKPKEGLETHYQFLQEPKPEELNPKNIVDEDTRILHQTAQLQLEEIHKLVSDEDLEKIRTQLRGPYWSVDEELETITYFSITAQGSLLFRTYQSTLQPDGTQKMTQTRSWWTESLSPEDTQRAQKRWKAWKKEQPLFNQEPPTSTPQ